MTAHHPRQIRAQATVAGAIMTPVTDFDAETAIRLGGWDSRYAQVLDVQVSDAAAAALVDSNGDGADVNVDLYVRGSDGSWEEVASSNGSIETSDWCATWTDDDRLVLTRLRGGAL
jgi:hypothetical protein